MKELLESTEVILDCLSDGVYVCDRERKIVYWSKSAERITGWQSEDLLGRLCLDDILRHEDKDGNRMCGEEHCPLHRSIVTGVTTTVPIIVFAHGKDGRKIPMQVTTAPIRNGADEVVGGVETFRDASPLLVDLERAKKIQAQTLEQELPDDPRLRFSTFYLAHDIVGGDYYGVKQLDQDRYGFLLADMEGHGLVGAFEIHNAQDELLGVDGLAGILKSLDYPQTPLNMGALAEELLKFSNDIRLQDDIAIVEMRFLGQPPSD